MGIFYVIIAVLFAATRTLCESTFVKGPLVSRKLCNNDPMNLLSQKCYNSQYDKEIECDSRSINSNHCTQANYTASSMNLDVWNELGAAVDSDITVRRIAVDFSAMKSMNMTLFGSMVDSFLLPRPMWSVVLEPFNITDEKVYILERYSQLWDPYFEHIARLQFPSAERCARSMMIIGRADCIHPGYSDVRKLYFEELGHSPVISAIYVPLDPHNIGATITGFVSNSDCPLEHKNKWTCAFLQMTNCTLPAAIETVKHDDRGLELYNSTEDGGGFFHSITELYVDHLKHKSAPLMISHKRIVRIMNNLPAFVYTSPFTHAANMFKFHGPDEHQVPDFLFMEFLFRKNAFYRRKVAELLAGFRAKYNLGSAIRTKERKFVAVHIRRSDRTLRGVNMTDFCHHLLVQRFSGVPQNCTYEHGVVRQCQGNEDVLGCNELGDVPVGAITLDAVVREAELLIGPTIRNMILFSEEVEWLDSEIAKARVLHPEWRFLTLDTPVSDVPPKVMSDEEDSGHRRKFDTRAGGTASGVFFHATIDLVQECDALLGHFNSGVPMTFAGAMCHHHAGMEGICPPVYNLKYGL